MLGCTFCNKEMPDEEEGAEEGLALSTSESFGKELLEPRAATAEAAAEAADEAEAEAAAVAGLPQAGLTTAA
jgi:hypothetical protein